MHCTGLCHPDAGVMQGLRRAGSSFSSGNPLRQLQHATASLGRERKGAWPQHVALDAKRIGIAGVLTCQAAATHSNASQRIVITGQGIASCFGNDVDTFYEKCARIGSIATASDQHYHAW